MSVICLHSCTFDIYLCNYLRCCEKLPSSKQKKLVKRRLLDISLEIVIMDLSEVKRVGAHLKVRLMHHARHQEAINLPTDLGCINTPSKSLGT